MFGIVVVEYNRVQLRSLELDLLVEAQAVGVVFQVHVLLLLIGKHELAVDLVEGKDHHRMRLLENYAIVSVQTSFCVKGRGTFAALLR